MKQNCYCFGDELHVSQLEKHNEKEKMEKKNRNCGLLLAAPC